MDEISFLASLNAYYTLKYPHKKFWLSDIQSLSNFFAWHFNGEVRLKCWQHSFKYQKKIFWPLVIFKTAKKLKMKIIKIWRHFAEPKKQIWFLFYLNIYLIYKYVRKCKWTQRPIMQFTLSWTRFSNLIRKF